MAKIILGLAGEIACGKGTIARYAAQKYGAKTVRFSTILRDILSCLYLEQSRTNMQILSTVLRQNFGEDLFTKAVARDVEKETSEITVIDGIRRLADISYLENCRKFKLAYIEADVIKCYERLVKRKENFGDGCKSFDDFRRERESESEIQIKNLKEIADFLIDNNGTFEDLYGQTDKILSGR